MSYPYIVQGSNVTIVIGNVPHTFSKTHLAYQKILDAIKAQDWEQVRELAEPKKIVLKYGKGNITISNGELNWKGSPLHNALTTRMIAMLQEGFPVEPLANFMENLMLNPSKRAVDELYGFLEKNSLPITPDGHFLAYKRVRGNYTDVHSGSMDNSVGKIVEMERNQVDDDRNRTCSSGLHFCSESYLKSFGGERTVIVKINPRDVVSIPSDYNEAKGRACRYEVIGEIGNTNTPDSTTFNRPVQDNANNTIKKVTSHTKFGSTDFYRGYTDGYTREEYRPDTDSYRGRDAYWEGYEKGTADQQDGVTERYRYVANTAGAWPQPVKRG